MSGSIWYGMGGRKMLCYRAVNSGSKHVHALCNPTTAKNVSKARNTNPVLYSLFISLISNGNSWRYWGFSIDKHTAFAILLAFALLRIQPVNQRVYFTKWYINGAKKSPGRTGTFAGSFVNLDFRTYLTFLNWMPNALEMSEEEIINHAGLDSAVFLRMFTLGLKIFIPATLVPIIIIPVNVSSGTLSFLRNDLVFSDIDKLSISNVPPRSSWFFIHILMEYLLTLWACFLLYKEYDAVTSMRFRFLASKRSTVEEFTILVRNVPRVSGQSVSESVEEFFEGNHHGTYNCHKVVYNANKFARFVKKCKNLQNWLDYNQLKLERCPEKIPTRKEGFLGLWGKRVDSIDWYKERIRNLNQRMRTEFDIIQSNPNSVLPVAFVMFKSRWGAAVSAETQQSRNPTLWLTSWAPEPRDIYWKNLAIPFVSLRIRKLVVLFMLFSLVFFYMIPITFVQSLANLEGIEKAAPFLKWVIELKFMKSFLQGFLPGLALKIFLSVLPAILLVMSKLEGYISMSKIELRAAGKYYYFMLVNVFLGSIVAGTAFEQLRTFLHQSPSQFPRTIGVSIPMKGTFFITYIMVDGWAGIASEILRLKPLLIFHLKNMFLVKTERDRERAMDPKSVSFPETIPQLQLYFLLGSVYAVVTPILIPFILVFFTFAYLVFRHQIINVYNQEYESVAAFWPHVHGSIVASLVISHLLLMGLLSTKEAAKSTPLLVVLPILTLAFHQYCKHRFEPTFRKFPIEEAVAKDRLQETKEPGFYLHDSMLDEYLHPVFKSFQIEGWDDGTLHSKDEHVDSPACEPANPAVREVHYAYHYYERGHNNV